MECQLCFSLILSKKHLEKCNTISMWEKMSYPISTFTNVMTYGLCGCSVAVFISNNKLYIIHDPLSENVINFITKYNYEKKVLLKVPYDTFNIKEPKDKIWKSLTDYDIEYSLYSEMIGYDNKYNSTLYIIKKNNVIYYSGRYGEWKILYRCPL